MLPAFGLGPGLHPAPQLLRGWLEAKGKLATKAGSREGALEHLESLNLCPYR